MCLRGGERSGSGSPPDPNSGGTGRALQGLSLLLPLLPILWEKIEMRGLWALQLHSAVRKRDAAPSPQSSPT